MGEEMPKADYWGGSGKDGLPPLLADHVRESR